MNSRLEISNRFPWITSHVSADRMTVLRPLGKIKIVRGELGPRRNGKHTCNGSNGDERLCHFQRFYKYWELDKMPI